MSSTGAFLHGHGAITSRSIRRHLEQSGLVKPRPKRPRRERTESVVVRGLVALKTYVLHPTKGWRRV